jgi:hypothetical protein
MRIVLLLLAGVLLSGCTSVSVEKPSLEPLDTGLTKPCLAPAPLPASAAKVGLSERQVVEIIGRDRLALTDCSRRQAALVRIYERRDAQIGGAK